MPTRPAVVALPGESDIDACLGCWRQRAYVAPSGRRAFVTTKPCALRELRDSRISSCDRWPLDGTRTMEGIRIGTILGVLAPLLRCRNSRGIIPTIGQSTAAFTFASHNANRVSRREFPRGSCASWKSAPEGRILPHRDPSIPPAAIEPATRHAVV